MKIEASSRQIVELKTPGSILFGVGAHEKLPERIKEVSDGPVLIVTDEGLVKAGTAEKIKYLVSAAGLEVSIFDGVKPDPDRESVDQCLNSIKSAHAKILVGLGGGSSLDVAKVASALTVNAGEISDYVGIGKLPKKGLPTILMPTTSGTGSEVSPIAVISDRKQHLKLGIVSPHLYCDTAIIDPILTVSCPPKTTAASGMDALTHAVEIYTNKFAVPMIDTLVLEAIRLAGKYLRACVHDGENLDARAGMSLASLYAGLGLGPVNTAGVHALAYPLGGTFDIPHGLANSILLPYVMEFNRPACLEKFAGIADALGVCGVEKIEEKAEAAVEKIVKLSKDVSIPQRLREINIPQDAISQMAESAMKVTRLLKNNPREITLEDAKNIYEKAY